METQFKPRLRCFVIMPFTDTVHSANGAQVPISAAQWVHIYDEWIKKAVESYPEADLSCNRSAAVPGNFVKGIIQEIDGAELVVADLTGNRPNVYYELGIRHALRTGTIMITQDFSALPNDLRSYYCFEYNYTSAAHEYAEAFERFEARTHEKIRSVINNNFPSDSPVSDFLGYQRYSIAREFEQEQDRLIVFLEVFKDIAVKIHSNCENVTKKWRAKRNSRFKDLSR